ncbi:MAG: hypothetical protein ACJ8F1_06040 [Polyangia bacterium]
MHSILSDWENFYFITGGAAAALIGLQFVASVLGAELRAVGGESVTRAFGTPNIVHFGVVLLNAALLSAPWRSVSRVAMLVGAFGLAGMAYTLLVARHARRQTVYKPVLEDWIWHAVAPFVAYASMLVSALLLPGAPEQTLFVVAAGACLLLCTGIHNAWDSLNYIALRRRPPPGEQRGNESDSP